MTRTITLDVEPGCLDWPLDLECCPDWPGEDSTDEQAKARALTAQRIASNRLRRLTAGRWGLCEEVVRPCRDVCQVPVGDLVLSPYLKAGRMQNACRGGCVEDCSCSVVCRTTLPGPVARVLEVRVHGQVLPADAYLVTEPPDNWLVRLDGGCWPECQHMAEPADGPGSFAVRYLRGNDPEDDPDAIRAVSALACELFRKACGQKCRLPGRIRTVSRQGVTYDMLDQWPKNGTGLDEVDEWLALVNPNSLRAPAMILTPDLPMPRFHGRGAQW
ncbi:hypothetical protein [Streptacidiphilus cavernicola]|uniref:Head-to-tail adaptor n=1 Tax=Streptacidiphilus cavernicola TaxID=3342716 RepID=A0ABV6VZ04_9ACTN